MRVCQGAQHFVYAYLREGCICSKDEAGAWAMDILPEGFRGIVTQALEVYRGNGDDERFDAAALEGFAAYMDEQVKALLAAAQQPG